MLAEAAAELDAADNVVPIAKARRTSKSLARRQAVTRTPIFVEGELRDVADAIAGIALTRSESRGQLRWLCDP